jgi:hypothetical protein
MFYFVSTQNNTNTVGVIVQSQMSERQIGFISKQAQSVLHG